MQAGYNFTVTNATISGSTLLDEVGPQWHSASLFLENTSMHTAHGPVTQYTTI